MIYDYENKEGYVSLWIGQCKDYSVLDHYLSTIYLEEDLDDIEEAKQNEVWKNLFLADNQDRACEEELKDYFNYEFYNQFEYDFGFVFDEDYREACVLDSFTEDLEILFDGFSFCDSFLDELRDSDKPSAAESNTAVVLYDFQYDGSILEVKHDNIRLHFLGCFRYKKPQM